MKKSIVILISVTMTAAFAGLVYYGLKYSRGAPTTIEKVERPVVEVPFSDASINLAEGLSSDIWDSIPGKEIKMTYQLMVLPWPKAVVPEVSLKAFHDARDIYFYMRWKDDAPDTGLDLDKFSDACAVMFPLADKIEPSSIMMGFTDKANIWQWKASQDREFWMGEAPQTDAYADYYYPFEEEELFTVSKTAPLAAVNDLAAIRIGTVTPKERQDVEGRGYWDESAWQVVFKRPFNAVDPEVDAVFARGKKRLCAFAVWNGSKGDRGGRKSISDWVELEIK